MWSRRCAIAGGGRAGPASCSGGCAGTVASKHGTVIAFERVGDGPPLILFDAAFCYRANGPTRALPLLATFFTG